MSDMMMTGRNLVLLTSFTLLFGCAAKDPVIRWQDDLQAFIEREGGNPAVLRNVDQSPTSKSFGSLGPETGGLTKTRVDTYGKLAGHIKVDESHWFVFLLGVVKHRGNSVAFFDKPVLQSILPVAVSEKEGQLTWVVGKMDPAQLAKYISRQDDRWRKSHPSRKDEKAPNPRFPTEADNLQTEQHGSVVIIKESTSGARWPLNLSDRPE